MPFYNHLRNWNGLDIEVSPINPWRKRFPFWPYFIGQEIQFELKVIKKGAFEKDDLNFHLVERMTEEEKPRMISPTLVAEESSSNVKFFRLQNSGRVTAKGEVRFWLSNRGYVVENEPIFAAEVVYLDSLIIPSLLVLVGPFFCLLLGLILGLLIAG